MRKTTPWRSKVWNRLLTLLFLLAFSPYGWGQVIISQYIETSTGSTPKGIEIWNNSGSTIDFSTSNLVLNQYTNGSTTATLLTTISTGTLLNGAVCVIGTNADVSGTGTGFKDFVESNGATFFTLSVTFNGDDALEIKIGGIRQDVFGTIGTDPGSSWSVSGVATANQNIALKTDIVTADNDGWSDPSLRFETKTTDNSLTGFGIAPLGAVPPTLSSTTPVDDATDIAKNTTLSMTFDENIVKGTGNIVVYQSLDDAVLATIDVTTADVSVTNAIATITLPGNLPFGTECYVNVDATAFTDASANAYAGIGDKTS